MLRQQHGSMSVQLQYLEASFGCSIDNPLRDRTVVVHPNLPEYLAAILQEDGLWRIHRAGPRASFRHNRKATLWRLPFRRVFYLDADMQFQTDGPVLPEL